MRILQVLMMTVLLAYPVSFAGQPIVSTYPGEQMRIDLSGVSVTASGSGWNINAPMLDDNGNTDLPRSYRRWWHFEIANLNAETGETLNVFITNAGYVSRITPVWSLDGGKTYERVAGVLPSHSAGVHTFTIETPPGVEAIRLAKFYPYTLPMFETFRASLVSYPFLTEEIIGTSRQGRDIYMYTLTDPAVSDAGKERVWIHSAVHPAENTAYFMCEGLIQWLLSGVPEADIILQRVIFNIVPMANPDGVHLGNYRTNADSVNLEVRWSPPYNSTVPEVVALRAKIEEFMGTPGSPGLNPITLLFNLHATHAGGYPFHNVHEPTYHENGTGVIPEVRFLEDKWVDALQARNAFCALRVTQGSSSLAQRNYVTSMMHDRYTLQSHWEPVMALTFEGTYQLGPGSDPSTAEDYRRIGADMGPAIADYYGIDLTRGTDHWSLF